MKPIGSDDSDRSLRDLLTQWKVEASLPPRFSERVWQRIAVAEAGRATSNPWLHILNRVHGFLVRPATAAGYVTALLVLGFALGLARGFSTSARVERDLSTRYVQQIDPYQRLEH